MRKLQIICERDMNQMMEHVDNFFKKCRDAGYPVVSTHYTKEPCSHHYAYIEYETEPPKRK